MTARRHSMQARQQAGRELRDRRVELDPRFENRWAFVKERKIGYKLSQYAENPPEKRASSAITWRDTIARAYGVTFESTQDILNEVPGAHLAAAPGEPPVRARGRHRAPAAELLPFALPPAREDAAREDVGKITEAREDWRIAYAAAHPGIAVKDVPEPSGAELFPPGSTPDAALDAMQWDQHLDVLPTGQRIWLVAELRALRVAARERQAGTG